MAGIAAILLTPWIAMQFTDEVHWTRLDFAMAGALLIGALAAYELAALFVRDRKQRLLVGGALFMLVLFLWAEGAVGIF